MIQVMVSLAVVMLVTALVALVEVMVLVTREGGSASGGLRV